MRAGPAFRGIYRANVEWTPWLYDFFYDRIDRWRWFARAAKAVTSAWAARGLRPVLDRVDPDLILSTYPLGSGGLARAALGLRAAPFTVLVACGVYAFGAVEEAVDALLRAGGDRVQVVVACS